MLRAEADPAARAHLIYALNKDTNLKDFATGCDADIGGTSTCVFDVDAEGDGRFWGELRREVKGEWRGKVRGGYAGFRNKVSRSSEARETTRHEYLERSGKFSYRRRSGVLTLRGGMNDRPFRVCRRTCDGTAAPQHSSEGERTPLSGRARILQRNEGRSTRGHRMTAARTTVTYASFECASALRECVVGRARIPTEASALPVR